MKVSWDDYSKYKESHKSHVPNHQSDKVTTSPQQYTTSPHNARHGVAARRGKSRPEFPERLQGAGQVREEAQLSEDDGAMKPKKHKSNQF